MLESVENCIWFLLKPQQFVLSQDWLIAEMVHQSEALGVVQLDRGGCGEDQQEDEEQAEVENLPHKGGLVQHLLLALVLQ